MSSILCGITFCSDSRNKHTNQQQTQPKHENNIRPNYNSPTPIPIHIPIDRTDQTSNIISNNNIIKSYPYNHWVQNNILISNNNPPLKKPSRPPPKITRRKTRVGIILLFETNELDAKGEVSDSENKNVQHRHTNPSHTKTNTYSMNSEYKYRQYRTRSTKYNNKRQSYNSNNSHNTCYSRSYLHRRNSYYQSQDQLSQLSETNLYSRYRQSSTSSMIVENTNTDESSMELDEKLILERIWEGNDTSESSFTFTGEKSPTYVCLTRGVVKSVII